MSDLDLLLSDLYYALLFPPPDKVCCDLVREIDRVNLMQLDSFLEGRTKSLTEPLGVRLSLSGVAKRRIRPKRIKFCVSVLGWRRV